MSTSSKPKSRPPAHQNTYGFKHNKNSKLTKQIASVGTEGLCRRCADKIEWRKKYRKYKPLSAPKKCNSCTQKSIKAAYRSLCNDCATAAAKCPGCAEPKTHSNRSGAGDPAPSTSHVNHDDSAAAIQEDDDPLESAAGGRNEE